MTYHTIITGGRLLTQKLSKVQMSRMIDMDSSDSVSFRCSQACVVLTGGFLVALLIGSLFMSEILPEQDVIGIYTSQVEDESIRQHIYQRPVININKTCRALQFINQTSDPLKSLTSSDIELLSGCRHVFYLRVPKCGSRGLRFVFETLGVRYGYNTARSVICEEKKNNDVPLVVTQHKVFADYSANGETQPVLINVLRDPISHVISTWSWKKYGSKLSDNGTGLHPPPDWIGNMTLDECLATRGGNKPCIPDGIIPYICGRSEFCFVRGEVPSMRLQLAKTHLASRFLVVGVTEQLKEFLEVLETLLPGMFFNATTVFEESMLSSVDNWSSVHKEEINSSSLQVLKSALAEDYHLYHFAQARFYSQLLKTRTFRANL